MPSISLKCHRTRMQVTKNGKVMKEELMKQQIKRKCRLIRGRKNNKKKRQLSKTENQAIPCLSTLTRPSSKQKTLRTQSQTTLLVILMIRAVPHGGKNNSKAKLSLNYMYLLLLNTVLKTNPTYFKTLLQHQPPLENLLKEQVFKNKVKFKSLALGLPPL